MKQHYGKSNSPRVKDARIRARLSDSSLVSEEESDLKVASELNNLTAENKKRAREMIRLLFLFQEGIDKRRLLSDIPGGGELQAPGDKMLADAFIDLEAAIDGYNSKLRVRSYRNRQDLDGIVSEFRTRLDRIEGWHDPDRALERLIKAAENDPRVTCPKKNISA